MLYGGVLKNYQLVFAVALALPLGLHLLSYLGFLIQVSFPSSLSFFDLVFSLPYYLGGMFGSFALFNFLGRTFKIGVVKPIVLALFFGFLAGNLIWSIFMPFFSGSSVISFLGDKVVDIVNLVFGWFFFPALAGLLFAELREKKIK